MPTRKLSVECQCIPKNPFYIRWINPYSGFDHWMFSKRQTFERELKNVETFEPYIANYATASGTTLVIDKTLESKVTVGADGLTPKEWKILSFIADSPLVQWYDTESVKWVDVVVEKSKLAMQTDSALHALEFTLQLPTPQLAL